jgi:tRNA(Arg) A34 adenosine deaminase TadA
MKYLSYNTNNMELDHESFMKKAYKKAGKSVERGAEPFGCVIVKKSTGEIVGDAHDMVTLTNDPSLHAEIMAINHACHYLGSVDLSDCIMYTSCEPCPMCLAAVYWAHIDTVYYGSSVEDAAAFGFEHKFIYDEFEKPKEERKVKMTQIVLEDSAVAFKQWEEKV